MTPKSLTMHDFVNATVSLCIVLSLVLFWLTNGHEPLETWRTQTELQSGRLYDHYDQLSSIKFEEPTSILEFKSSLLKESGIIYSQEI